jgi:hypothetical protein
MTYEISKAENAIQVVTPYNRHFIRAAKAEFHAKWDGDCWCFDLRDESEVRALVKRFYGWTAGMPLVSAMVFVDRDLRAGLAPVMLLGRVLASATGRDSGAELGDAVRIRAGSADSGGSAKNWTTEIKAGTELVVHDLPQGMVQDYLEGRGTQDGVRVELIAPAAPATPDMMSKNRLVGERAALLARIAEINSLLTF